MTIYIKSLISHFTANTACCHCAAGQSTLFKEKIVLVIRVTQKTTYLKYTL